MPFKVEVQADSSGTWAGNGLTFETSAAAESYARDLAMRWTLVRDWRIVAFDVPAPAVAVESTTPRSLRTIAYDVKRNWAQVHYAAVPYLDAMTRLDAITDMFDQDSAASIVRCFLSNAKTWRGDDARRIKAELKQLLGGK